MLVLTRKSNQSIMIGDEVEISVLSVLGEKVRIGIRAPRSIPVFRKEIYLEIQDERSREAPVGDGDGADPGTAAQDPSGRAQVDAALRELGGG